ncbi:CASP-like protein 4B3 [Chenopodium quinoa]|uniref:CASP-like protein n=1 Tax=Chenopodium quinoa TaxID=63459 RepID=A0A803MB73_CHEQI|nr:CASP-like protein 4B3 [Chenopodium quinoa]
MQQRDIPRPHGNDVVGGGARVRLEDIEGGARVRPEQSQGGARMRPEQSEDSASVRPEQSEGSARVRPEQVNTVSSGASNSDGQKLLKGERLKLWGFIFRICAMVVSFLSSVLMVSVSDFHVFPGLSYVLGIAIIVVVYTTVQVGIKGHELRTKEDVIPPKAAIWIDFCGDQFLAYVLFSSSSTGATLSIILSSGVYMTVGLQLVAASVSMSVLTCIFLAFAALISSYCLFANI